MTFLAKFLHNVNILVLKGLCKFQVDKPINARVTAVHSLKKSPIHLYCDSNVGWQKNSDQTIFLFYLIEIHPTTLANNSVFIDPNDFKVWFKDRLCGLTGHSKFWAN